MAGTINASAPSAFPNFRQLVHVCLYVQARAGLWHLAGAAAQKSGSCLAAGLAARESYGLMNE